MKKLLWALAFLLWCVPAVDAGVGFAVSPSSFRLKKSAGEPVSAEVVVENKGSYAVSVTTDVTDMVTLKGEDGLSVRDETPAGTTPHSCAKWIQLAEQGPVIVPAGERKTVKFAVTPPSEATSGGYGAYLFFVAKPAEPPAPSAADKPEVQLITVPRLGISVIYEVEGTIQRQGELTDLTFTPPTLSEPMKVRHGFQNTGNAEVILTGNFHILDEAGALAGKGTLKTLKTFPGEAGVTETTWYEPLPPGHYALLFTFELGPDAQDAIVREEEFDVS